MKKLSLYLIAFLYVLAGLNHFFNINFYETIMPTYIGYHKQLILISGVCEIVLGLLMIPRTTRKMAATLITLMLILFLWLHIQMLVDFLKSHDKHLWIAILRIPLQFILIAWAYSFVRSPSK